jgi:hypothetical protein
LEEKEVCVDLNTKAGFKDCIKNTMRVFHYNYDFSNGALVDDPFEKDNWPSLEEVYYYCKYVIVQAKMEQEIPIMALVYIERFLEKTGLLMNHTNWRRIILITLVLASKVSKLSSSPRSGTMILLKMSITLKSCLKLVSKK